MSRQVKVWYTCKACQHEQEVTVYPIIPAQTYGPPENCSPEEGGEIEPEVCDKCETPIDAADCHEKTADDERSESDADGAAYILRESNNNEYNSYFVHAVVMPDWIRTV